MCSFNALFLFDFTLSLYVVLKCTLFICSYCALFSFGATLSLHALFLCTLFMHSFNSVILAPYMLYKSGTPLIIIMANNNNMLLPTVVDELNLSNLSPNFTEEKIDVSTATEMTDEQLNKLGVKTISDPARLHLRCNNLAQQRQSVTTSTLLPPSVPATMIARERALLSSPYGTNSRNHRTNRLVCPIRNSKTNPPLGR